MNYWIFDYPPERELEVRERIKYMQNKNAKGGEEFELMVFDLYDIIIDFLDKNNFLEDCYKFEKKKGLERIAKPIDRDIQGVIIVGQGEETNVIQELEEYVVTRELQKHIKEKLERFGLLQSKNEEISDDNLEKIVKYLQDVEKERKKSRPRDIKLPRLKKISSSDTYRITSLGREYLQLVKE